METRPRVLTRAPRLTVDFNQLKLVTQIAAHGSLTRAAIALNMEQSVISRQLTALETEYGGRLFYRTGRCMTLTEFGAGVLPRIQALLEQAQRMEEQIKAEAGVPSGDVRVGLLPGFSYPLVNQLFRETRLRYPRVHLHFFEGSNGQLDEWVNTGSIDIALVYRYGPVNASVEKIQGFCDACLISSAQSPIGSESTIGFRQLHNLPLVLPSVPNPFRVMLDDIAKQQQISLTVAVEADSIPIQKNLVADGDLYAILGAPSIRRETIDGTLRSSRITDCCKAGQPTRNPFGPYLHGMFEAQLTRIHACLQRRSSHQQTDQMAAEASLCSRLHTARYQRHGMPFRPHSLCAW
jgi:LysR family transcriptional regulator, nitrogen assimilation regulatory protein